MEGGGLRAPSADQRGQWIGMKWNDAGDHLTPFGEVDFFSVFDACQHSRGLLVERANRNLSHVPNVER